MTGETGGASTRRRGAVGGSGPAMGLAGVLTGVLTGVLAGVLAVVLGACSDAADPVARAVASVRFAEQPTNGVAGEPFSVRVEVLNADGRRVSSAVRTVQLAVAGAENNGPAATATTVRGVATFEDFTLTAAGEDYRLRATTGGLGAVSLPFAIGAGPVSATHSGVAPPPGGLRSNTPQVVRFTFVDAFDNPVVNVPVSVATTAAGAVFTPANGTTSAEGVFTTVLRIPGAGPAPISATLDATTLTFDPPLAVADACAPLAMAFPGTVHGSLAQGAGCPAGGNVDRAIHPFTVGPLAGSPHPVGARFTLSPAGVTIRYEIRANPAQPAIAFATNQPASTEWLLPPGTYELRVETLSGAGPYMVVGSAGTGAAGQVTRAIILPGTYTGQSLAPTDLRDSFGAFVDYFLVADGRPCTITVQSTAFAPYLMLFNGATADLIAVAGPEGDRATISRTEDGPPRNACTSINQPIIIAATSAEPDVTGPYSLIIEFH